MTAALIKRVSAYLAQTPADADYFKVTDEQIMETRDLFHDILTARFPSVSRDNLPIELILGNRAKYNMSVIAIPHGADIDDTPSAARHVAELARVAEHASSIAAEAQRMLAFHASEVAKALEAQGERARDLAGLELLIDANEIDKAIAERDRLLDKYAPIQSFNRDEQYADGTRRVDDDLAEVIDKLGEKLSADVIDPAKAELSAAIDALEPLVGVMIPNPKRMTGHEAPFADRSGELWRLFRHHRVRVGKSALRDQLVRINRLVDEDRGVRLAATRKAAI